MFDTIRFFYRWNIKNQIPTRIRETAKKAPKKMNAVIKKGRKKERQ